MTDLPFSDLVVIFDLDGTLIDSAPDLTAALNHVLQQEGIKEVAPPIVRPLVGHGAKALLIKGYALYGLDFPEGAKGERLISVFLDYYTDHIADQTTLFAGAMEAMDAVEAQGGALAVCTNKLERLAFPVLEKLGVVDRFDPIICRDSLPEYKPSPLPLQEILRRTGRPKGVMLGDTMTDLNAARAANLPALYATFGYGDLDGELQKDEQRLDHFDALPGILTRLFS